MLIRTTSSRLDIFQKLSQAAKLVFRSWVHKCKSQELALFVRSLSICSFKKLKYTYTFKSWFSLQARASCKPKNWHEENQGEKERVPGHNMIQKYKIKRNIQKCHNMIHNGSTWLNGHWNEEWRELLQEICLLTRDIGLLQPVYSATLSIAVNRPSWHRMK